MRALLAMGAVCAAGVASAQVMTLPDAGALRASVARAGVTPQRAVWPADAPVRIRLATELADDPIAAPQVRAMLAASPGVAVAEPADYVLTTPDDMPQTLMLERAEPPQGEAEPDATASIAAMGPWQRELGNLVLRDYDASFADAIRRIRWTRALLSLGDGAAAQTTTCLTDSPDDPAATQCDAAGRFVPVGDRPPVSRSDPAPSSLAVRNDARGPRYLYLVDVAADYRILPIPLGDDGPVAPGAWARSAADVILPGRGQVLVTVSSARPLPADLLVDPDRVLRADGCDGSPVALRLCGRRGADRTGWSARATYYFHPRQAIPRVGGGVDASSNSAPWMAAFYSTVPYTAADFAADDAKPAGEKEYLRARAGAGLAHRCGGTMIAPDLMLTAAHCVAKGGFAGDGAARVLRERRVRTGSHRLGVGGTTWAIDAMVVHAGYRAGAQPNDIALVRLRADRAAAGAMPLRAVAKLPRDGRLDAVTPVAAFGWGFTGQVAPGARAILDTAGRVQRNPEALQFGPLQTMAWKACRARVGALLDAGMVCAETRRRGPAPLRPGMTVFSCVGDSGGPLVREDPGGDVLVGVASWSKGCGYGDNPSVYTNVAHFAPWVADARRRLLSGRVVYLDDRGGARIVPPPGVSGR
ncbi:hypothetical protein ASG29_15160 [Sphingomonas sp. Leaf412]|uniref:S1 family serine peptidase n=1 Tax=Sphingomonas sp. Leaf412 TaxID=1736370 RepID=UPI0006F6C4D2|nr:serine protease [Sphingomonas sp. Leaf412]KQT31299.1 hypothetical protein ASG29_15160 [Sphingomonas sp. Leaf412]